MNDGKGMKQNGWKMDGNDGNDGKWLQMDMHYG